MLFQIQRLPFLLLAAILLLAACARELTPTGGPADKEPPKIDSLRSTRNMLTNYQKEDIVLRFDEWLQLKDVANQVFISPPTTRKPQVTLDGKKVVIKFDEAEILRPNTTYTLHLGNAIQDLNEGNPARDMRFVFSTGQTIDSLTVQGRVTDALTGQPAKAISVVLYSNATDSCVLKVLPDYLAVTSDDGQYRIQNVREGSYTIAAFKDENKNNKWSILEPIGFTDSLLTVNGLVNEAPPIAIFSSEVEQKLVSKDLSSFGSIRLGYTNQVLGIDVRPLSDSVSVRTVYLNDTIVVWYDHQRTTDWQLLVGLDTLTIKPLQRSNFIESHKLAYAGAPKPSGKGKGKSSVPTPSSGPNPNVLGEQVVTASQQAVVSMAYPVVAMDTTRIWCISGRDSSVLSSYSIAIDTANSTSLRFQFSAPATEIYKMTFLPGAFSDMWQNQNADTLIASFRFITGEETGNLHLKIEQLKQGERYILELASNAGRLPTRSWVAEGTTHKIEVDYLVPGAYTATITHDKNGNGRWDSGNYMLRRQPEPIFIQKLEQVKPNWTVDAVITLENTVKAGKKLKGQ